MTLVVDAARVPARLVEANLRKLVPVPRSTTSRTCRRSSASWP